MPEWSEADIVREIGNGSIGAVSLDTNIFESSECNLRYRLFTSLSQFDGTGISYLLSDVVVGEIKSHIAARAKDAAAKVRAAAREFQEAWRADGALQRTMDALGLPSDHDAAAQAQIDAYRSASKFTEIASIEFVDLSGVLAKYFARSAPFESISEKKNEFPDALALSALEAWGEKNQKFVLAVAKDKGWQRFAKEAKWVACQTDLRAVLGAFNAEDEFFARSVVARVNGGKGEEISTAIDQEIARYVEQVTPVIVAETGYSYDDEFLEATLLDRHPIDLATAAALSSNDDEIVIAFDVVIDLEIDAAFVFYIYDEGDSIPFASAQASQEVTVTLPCTIAVTRDPAEPALQDIELANPDPRVDFGLVEPDYSDGED
jgi:hypothetical protein